MEKKETTKLELEQIEALIRKARGNEAREALMALQKQGIPEGARLKFAELARRAGLEEVGARTLFVIVRPTGKLKREATDADRVEYAACLVRLGSTKEAMGLLAKISGEKTPQVYLMKAMIWIKEWNYKEAIPLLRKYLQCRDLSDYETIVGMINLGLSLIYERRFGEAKSILGTVLEWTSGPSYTLIHANALRFLGNLEFYRNNFDAAIGFFKESESLLSSFQGLDLYFCRKWNAITEFTKDPKNKETQKLIESVRAEALALHHWESVRDIDYHVAMITKDEKRFEFLYFGTPFEEYRSRILQSWGVGDVAAEYLWQLGSPSKKSEIIDLARERKTKSGEYLKAGQTLDRLYTALTSDFYRPFKIHELYEKIFPGEFYAPGTSEYRVHQAIKRLRVWFEENAVSLTIVEEEGHYRLEAVKPCQIVIRLERKIKASGEIRLELLRDKLAAEFTVKEAGSILNLTRRRTAEIVLEAVQNGLIEKVGSGNKTRYRFTDCSKEEKLAS